MSNNIKEQLYKDYIDQVECTSDNIIKEIDEMEELFQKIQTCKKEDFTKLHNQLLHKKYVAEARFQMINRFSVLQTLNKKSQSLHN